MSILSVEAVPEAGAGDFVRARARASRAYLQRAEPSEMVVVEHVRGDRRLRRFRMRPAEDFSVAETSRVVTIAGRTLRVLSPQGAELGHVTLDINAVGIEVDDVRAIVRNGNVSRVVDLRRPGRPTVVQGLGLSAPPDAGLEPHPTWIDPPDATQQNDARTLLSTGERRWMLRRVRNAEFLSLFDEQSNRLGHIAVRGTITGAAQIDDVLYVARRDVETDSPLIAIRLRCR